MTEISNDLGLNHRSPMQVGQNNVHMLNILLLLIIISNIMIFLRLLIAISDGYSCFYESCFRTI